MEKEGQAQLPTRVLAQRLLDRYEILETLGHLTTFNGEVASMEKVRHPMIMSVASLGGGRRGEGEREGERGRERGGRVNECYATVCTLYLCLCYFVVMVREL